ncbi:MAG: lactonase family protein [Actinobacteria bacterium]|nr:lactonase family protein [Actinomycetota bacterium]
MAATGDLTSAGCVEDNDDGPDSCTASTAADGLEQTRDVVVSPDGADVYAVSPDGRSLYVAANSDDSIKRFDRNTSTGALTAQACVDDAGAGACAQSMAGLDAPARVLVSPDNLSVYASANGSDSVAALSRNPTTGALTPAGCTGDNDTGPPSCAIKADGLDAVWGLAISPDGSSLYTGSRLDNGSPTCAESSLPYPASHWWPSPSAGP